MAIYRWNGADEKIIDSVLEQDALLKKVPRLASFYEGVKEMRGWLGTNSFEAPYTRTRGWTEGRRMKRIGSVPYSVAAMIFQINPEAFKTREWTYAFLKAHPEYQTQPEKGP